MPRNYLHTLGQNIRRLRKQRRLTQEDVAEEANLNASYCGRIERGEVNVTLDTLLPIAQALNVELNELFVDEIGTMDVPRLRNDITRMVKRLDSQKLRTVHDLLALMFQKT